MLKKTILLAAACCTLILSHARQPAFFHLSTAEGLSDNFVNSLQRDRNGILWVGTSEGLNSYDGYSITTYFKEQYPQIGNNFIAQVVCDNQNRIWLRTPTPNLTLLNEKRQFILFTVGEQKDNQLVRVIINTKSRGPIVLKGSKHYQWTTPGTTSFQQLVWNEEKRVPPDITSFSHFDEDNIIFCGSNRLVLVNYKQLKVWADIPFPGISAAARLNEQEVIAIIANSNSLYRINLHTKKISREYKNLQDQNRRTLSNDLRGMCRITGDQFLITTRFSGAYLFDAAKETVERWQHNPVNNHSIGGDNTYISLYDTSGYIFITTRTSGIHFFNTKQPAVTYKPVFTGNNATVFDGFITAIAPGNNKELWLGAQDRLVAWDRETDTTRFIDYYLPGGIPLAGEETIRALYRDRNEHLWVGTSRHGLLVLDKQNKTIVHLDSAGALPANWINAIIPAAGDTIWVGTAGGICKINIHTKQITSFSNHPVLKEVSRLFCNALFVSKPGYLWIGNNRGAWKFIEKDNQLVHYTVNNGLAHNRVLSFGEDRRGDIYIGTADGLSIATKNGTMETYNRNNGLRNDKCECLLQDEEGFMWVANNNSILRFDPAHRNFAVFEEGAGFNHAGYRIRSCYKDGTGKLFWGSDKGLNYFFPKELNTSTTTLRPAIHALYTDDTVYRVTQHQSFSFPYNKSAYTFSFSPGELSGSKKIQFLYRLAGYDTGWYKPFTWGQATYRALEPGHYRFEAKASSDGKTWYAATYPISITVLKPWWQQLWVKAAALLLLATMVYAVYRYQKRRTQAKEIQKMLDYFSRSDYEHSTAEDILWDIAHNCISHLDFEDCVIYLLDEDRKMLIQKAAYGPKSPVAYEILNPIEIPVGKGIVGEVALTGKPIVVKNTSKDGRYITDDIRRLSEMAVPLVHEGSVIGVIDSEHTQRNFFRNHHLRALLAIASICSAKLSRAMAMDAMRKSQVEVMELNVKMAESRFLNLRLQMNPHFLFNSLSSIQNLIVSQQTPRAYKYLTLFSNFLRSLLKHADKNFITLDEELDILGMYIQLEALRFDKSFTYDIQVDETLANDEVLVPTLIIQPFAENAIWHGLMHKKGDKKLCINFTNNADEYLTCTIEDNGIGRLKARTIKEKKFSPAVHESKGISIIKERLLLLQQKTNKPAQVAIEDIYDHEQQPAGTKVIITIPYYNPAEV